MYSFVRVYSHEVAYHHRFLNRYSLLALLSSPPLSSRLITRPSAGRLGSDIGMNNDGRRPASAISSSTIHQASQY